MKGRGHGCTSALINDCPGLCSQEHDRGGCLQWNGGEVRQARCRLSPRAPLRDKAEIQFRFSKGTWSFLAKTVAKSRLRRKEVCGEEKSAAKKCRVACFGAKATETSGLVLHNALIVRDPVGVASCSRRDEVEAMSASVFKLSRLLKRC